MKTKKHCFISGPITNVPDFYENFKAAEEQVKSQGFIPVNPAASTKPLMDAGCLFDAPQWLAITTAILRQCECAFFLKGWEFSKGAKREHKLAESLGMKLYYQDSLY